MRTWYQRTEEDILEALHVTKDGHTSEAAARTFEEAALPERVQVMSWPLALQLQLVPVALT